MKAAYKHTANTEIVVDENTLEQWVNDPSVLFFLGPECSREDRYDSIGWARLKERIVQVRAGCPDYDGTKIAAFVDSLLPDDDSTSGEAVATKEALEGDLLEFEVAIAELAMRATELYVDVVLEPDPSAVRNWSERRATVWLTDVELEEELILLRQAREPGGKKPEEMPARVRRSGDYLIALEQAIKSAEKLRERATNTGRDGPARPLGASFEDRMMQLFGAEQVCLSLKQLHSLTVETVEDSPSPRLISLRGEDIEWLTNLLWHSLRFDLPIYPSNEELAFQLALLGPRRPGDSAHIARPKLSLATQDADHPEDVAESLSWVVEATMGSEGLSATSSRLFTAVAKILRQHADTWDPGLHSDSRPESGNGDGDAAGLGDAHELVPVAFSTSFDQQLERAILSAPGRTSVSIFVPVLVIERRRSTHAEFRWLYATALAPGTDAGARNALRRLRWQWAPTGNADWPVEEGISIVKINGAPLYRELDGAPLSSHELLVPNGTDARPRLRPDATLRHALVLSEFELLRNLRIEASSSDTFLGVLQLQSDQARRVLFMGHPIQDWQTRIRLLTRLFEPIHGQTAHEARHQNILFAETIEPVRTSLLFWADIVPARQPLKWIEDALTRRVRANAGRP